MKRNFLSIFLAIIMLFVMMPFSSAVKIEASPTEIIDLGDGFIGEIRTYTIHTDSFTRSMNNSIEGRKSGVVKYYGNIIGDFSLWGNFTYNGSSSKAIDHDWDAAAESGYSYSGGNSYCSGSSVKGSCTFTGGGYTKTVSLTITCDKNGNLS